MIYVCRDCKYEEADYDLMQAHTRAEHNREMRTGRKLAVGDVIIHNGIDCRVLELYENGNTLVQPLSWPGISVTVEYRVATKDHRKRRDERVSNSGIY